MTNPYAPPQAVCWTSRISVGRRSGGAGHEACGPSIPRRHHFRRYGVFSPGCDFTGCGRESGRGQGGSELGFAIGGFLTLVGL